MYHPAASRMGYDSVSNSVRSSVGDNDIIPTCLTVKVVYGPNKSDVISLELREGEESRESVIKRTAEIKVLQDQIDAIRVGQKRKNSASSDTSDEDDDDDEPRKKPARRFLSADVEGDEEEEES